MEEGTKAEAGRTRGDVDALATTAIHGGACWPLVHVRAARRKGCLAAAAHSNPSPHGGRGALPSEGGSPSDLLFLAGGGGGGGSDRGTAPVSS